MADPLPLEVCRRIVDHLEPIYDYPTLVALARTSRTLQLIAERLIYHSLYLVGAHAVPAVLATLLSRPALAAHTRQLMVHPCQRRNERTSHTYWTQLAELLLHAGTHAELLYIVAYDPDGAFSSWVLRSLHDASGSLRILRVPFWWDTEVAEFLESPAARGLTRLETGDTHPMVVGITGQQIPAPLPLHRGAVPRLGIVEAPPGALELLVPGRPVTHVRVQLGPATTLHTLPAPRSLLGECLVRSNAPHGVVALDIGDLTLAYRGETYSLEVMELAAQFLPHLAFIGRINFPWTKDMPISRLYKALIRLPMLHTLELVVGHIHPAVDGYWELATASELRTFSPSLRQIVFFKGYDRHRWIWLDHEADFVLDPSSEGYPQWGGV